jgi:hypothetical protein
MKFSRAFLIFLATTTLIWLINWYLVIIPIPKANEFFRNLPNYTNKYVSDTYPQDLIIDIQEGTVSVNRPSPYCFIFEPKEKFGVVFDTKAEPSANLFDASTSPYSKLCKPIAVVGSNFVVYQEKGDGSYKVQTISKELTHKITKSEIDKFISEWLPKILQYGKLAYWLIPFVIILFIIPWSLFINLFYALVVMLVLRISKIKVGVIYGDSYFSFLGNHISNTYYTTPGKILFSKDFKTRSAHHFPFHT